MSKVYEIVQKRVLERLEEAIKNGENFNWIKPWGSLGMPKNFVSKKAYSGINLLLLPMGGYYLTMKQINELGGKVIKGSKAFQVYFWSYIEPKGKVMTKEAQEEANAISEDGKEVKKIPIFKYYNVFHQSQIEGIEFPANVDKEHELNLNAEEIVNLYNNEVRINVVKGGDEAYYSSLRDEIVIPHNSQFFNVNEYYSAVLHEMVHSTGHKDRLNRLAPNFKFGDDNYSKEELVAEIGSSMLRAYCGILDNKADNNSIAYLKGWYSKIKNGNVNDITYASQQAQKAMNFILEKVEEFKANTEVEDIAI